MQNSENGSVAFLNEIHSFHSEMGGIFEQGLWQTTAANTDLTTLQSRHFITLLLQSDIVKLFISLPTTE